MSETDTIQKQVTPGLRESVLAAAVGGLLWAGFGLAAGVAVVDYLFLAAAAGVSFVLVASAVSGWRQHAQSIGLVLLTAALGCGASALLGAVLKVSTNHRPLGAVTWICITMLLLIGAAVAVARLRPSVRVSVVTSACLCGVLVVLALPAVAASVWAEAAVGLVLCVGVAGAKRFIGPSAARVWPLALLVLVGGTLGALLLGASQRLHEAAPLVAGIVGLLH